MKFDDEMREIEKLLKEENIKSYNDLIEENWKLAEQLKKNRLKKLYTIDGDKEQVDEGISTVEPDVKPETKPKETPKKHPLKPTPGVEPKPKALEIEEDDKEVKEDVIISEEEPEDTIFKPDVKDEGEKEIDEPVEEPEEPEEPVEEPVEEPEAEKSVKDEVDNSETLTDVIKNLFVLGIIKAGPQLQNFTSDMVKDALMKQGMSEEEYEAIGKALFKLDSDEMLK